MAKPDTRDHMVRALEAMSAQMTAALPDHETARQLRAEMNGLRLKAEALDNVNQRRSPLETPAAHAMKVAKRARAFDSEVTAALNRSSQLWAKAREAADRRIAEKVDLRPDAFASEIRSAFRTLSPQKQNDLIKELVDSNRGPELAAIVKAPVVLTGITEAQRAVYEQSIIARHAAPEFEEMGLLDEVYEITVAGTRAAGSFAKSLNDPAKLAAIESAAASADEADAAFNQTLNGG